VASALASAEADITRIDMEDETAQEATDLRFVIAVRDVNQLELALRNLRRTPSVLLAQRAKKTH
jgi:GTP pyrophosphokinase